MDAHRGTERPGPVDSPLFFNAWHNVVHWDTGLDARVPAGKAIQRIDAASVH